jgi:hypothetical protein
MLSIHLRLGLPSGLFPSGFRTQSQTLLVKKSLLNILNVWIFLHMLRIILVKARKILTRATRRNIPEDTILSTYAYYACSRDSVSPEMRGPVVSLGARVLPY